MAQNVGQSRGSQKHKQFVQDSANSYIVDAFKDMSLTAPVSPVDGEGYIVENVGSLDPSWGTIVGLADNDIIRWRQSKLEWQIVMKAVVDNQGFKAFVKEEDTLYVVDSGAEWIIASGSGGGVKNFAQKQAGAYKPGDWIQGNSGIFGAAGTLAGALEVETVAPLDGKKSFKYTTAAGSGNDWFYLLVDIDQYARGSVIAFTFDYQWDGDEDISVEIWDPTFTNQYSTELNLVKNTENDNKLSRNSRTIYAHPDTESQVVVGFQIASTESTDKTFIWDNLKVTDDIGTIGSSAEPDTIVGYSRGRTQPSSSTTGYSLRQNTVVDENLNGLATMAAPGQDFEYTALVDHHVTIHFSIQDGVTANNGTLQIRMRLDGTQISRSSTSGYNADNVTECSWSGLIKAGQVITGDGYNYRGSTGDGYYSIVGVQYDTERGKRFLQVPNGEKLKEVYSARINMATATVLSNGGVDWIDNVTLTSTGVNVVSFKPGIFSEVPALNMTVTGNNETIHALAGASTSQVTAVIERRNDGAGISYEYTLTAYKQGNDAPPDIVGVPVSIQGQTHEEDSIIRMDGINISSGGGQGTVNTEVIRFATLLDNRGSAITYVDSATEGSSFIINESGLYHMMATFYQTVNVVFSIVKNQITYTSGGTNCIAATELQPAGADNVETTSGMAWLNKGDVVRVTGSSTPVWNSSNWNKFTIAKVGTQPLLDGGVVQTPATNWKVDATGVGSYVAGTTVVQFSSAPVENRGDGVEWDPSISSYRILKDGVYSFHSHVQWDGGANMPYALGLFKNTMTTQSTFFNSTSQTKLDEYYARTDNTVSFNPTAGVNYTGYFTAGEYVNVATAATAQNLHGQEARSQFSVASVGEIEQYTSRVYKEDPIAYQINTLPNNQNNGGVVPSLRFENLEIGKTYRLSMMMKAVTGNVPNQLYAQHNGNVILDLRDKTTSDGNDDRFSIGGSTIFTATTDAVAFQYVEPGGAHGGYLEGNGTTGGTHAILEELPFHSLTSKFS